MKLCKTLLTAATLLLASNTAAASTCADLNGDYINNVGGTVRFEIKDVQSGLLTGVYIPKSAPELTFPLTGFINLRGKADDKKHNAVPISFAVNFQDDGSIVSWTGICEVKDGHLVLETEDHIVFTTADYYWSHVASNHDTLVPKK